MSDLFQLSADFYSQFPSPIVRDEEGVRLAADVQKIVQNSSFLSDAERKNLPRLVPFFGTAALSQLRDSLVRQNLRTLMTTPA